ncbi:branched-chain amino acid ABC transporter permease [Bosea sp. Tri-44]|uniref:branched-chain amino acid ABC transporter permease n=1 Tax=Bosea sp. Tri-44 TaxID=1972137 RepID=UPI00100DEA37|nr:branched-chain amino acid ABC transporter permease [Bosea sp. Tri-44]RXT51235.1 branched-chain amino acid ABC transporter permease [Bosea sp. Tri-44]
MFLQTVLLATLDGLSYGAQVFLVAVGLSLIFGVLRIVNVAHGSFYAIGAYVAASFGLLLAASGLSPWLSYPAMALSAVLVGVLLGGLLEVTLLRRIYGKEQVLQLLVTFAVFMIFEDLQKAIWGVSPYFVNTPLSLLGTVNILGINYSLYQLVVVPAFAVVVLLTLRYVLRSTRIGRIVTAVTDDREAAAAMGVDAAKVYLLTFMIGASLAAFGGALASGSTSLVPGMGSGMIILSFAVAATAGLGRIEGAAVAALMIGLGRSIAVYTAPEFDVLVPYLIMFVVLLIKPQGLFSVPQTRKV